MQLPVISSWAEFMHKHEGRRGNRDKKGAAHARPSEQYNLAKRWNTVEKVEQEPQFGGNAMYSLEGVGIECKEAY